jgi:hypothetical protein
MAVFVFVRVGDRHWLQHRQRPRSIVDLPFAAHALQHALTCIQSFVLLTLYQLMQLSRVISVWSVYVCAGIYHAHL